MKINSCFCIMLLAVFTLVACSSKKEDTKEQLKMFESAKLPTLSSMPPLYVGIEKDF